MKSENTNPDIIYGGGDIITMKGDLPEYAESLVVRDNKILFVGSLKDAKSKVGEGYKYKDLKGNTLLPGLIDAHTHICFAGSRAQDYSLRNSGATYMEIAKSGGGIWDTVTKTRAASKQELIHGVKQRAQQLVKKGITTIEEVLRVAPLSGVE